MDQILVIIYILTFIVYTVLWSFMQGCVIKRASNEFYKGKGYQVSGFFTSHEEKQQKNDSF